MIQKLKLRISLEMKELKQTALLLLALFSFAFASAQQKTIIRGRVIDKSDKTTVVGANVIEYDKDSRIINGTICNVNGDFVLEMRDVRNIVKVSFIGYITKEVKVDPTKPMTIELEISSHEFEAVVVSAQAKGYHSLTNVDDRDNASSRVKVDLKESREAGMLTVSDALQGKVSGLDILSSSGDPGAGSRLVIRGLSSMGNSKPLIVIDGIPQNDPPNYANFILGSANAEDIGNLVNIAVQDIKSVEILKDAASTSQYGSRGADGVLVIETHKGRLGKVQIDYSYKTSLNIQPPSIPMLSGDEYIMLQLEELQNSKGVFDVPPEIAYDPSYADFYNYSKNTDWIRAITKNALTQDHYFSVSGGGEKARYFTSLSYVSEGGTTINTSSKRFSTRVNLDYYLSKKLIFSVLFNYTNNKTNGNFTFNKGNPVTEMSVRKMAYIKAPNMSIWQYDANGNPTGEYFTPINSYQGDGATYFNPVAVAQLGKDNSIGNNLSNSFVLNYTFRPWLSFRETVSFEIDGSKSNNFLPYNAVGSDWLAWTVNKAEEGNNINQGFNTETQVSFNAPFENKKHVLSGSLNWITNSSRYEWMNIQSNKTPSVDIQDPSANAQVNWIGTGSGESRLLGALLSLNYKYADKYMLQTILREDAHTSFGANHRWGLFKGISAAWRFSEEPFLKNLPFLGESKLKASWGVSGKQPDDPYARFATYNSSSPNSYMTHTGIVPTQIQLNNLQWESITTTNVGLDLSLFKDRLNITAEVYKKKTSNLLFKNDTIPFSSGFETLKFLNGGVIENKGFDLMIDYKIINNEKLRWSVNFNVSRNSNAFTELPPNFNSEKSTSINNGEYPLRIVAGEPIGSFFGFKYQGVYSTDAEAVAKDASGNVMYDNVGAPIPMTYQGTYTFRGGDAKYADINHDGKIDLNDVVYIGDSNPSYYGGFGTAARYKNFDFSCSFQYRLGFNIINGIAIETQGMNDKNNQSKAVLSRWRVQGQDEPGMLPRAYLNNPANNLGSDRYVEKGDFLRMLNLMIGYRVGQKFCDKLKLRSLTITLSARKMMTITKYSGQDPEVGQDASDPFWIGVDNARTPPPRILTCALSIGF
jgi:TonB-linked SusC/RagA family outer membrane protein